MVDVFPIYKANWLYSNSVGYLHHTGSGVNWQIWDRVPVGTDATWGEGQLYYQPWCEVYWASSATSQIT